MIKSTEYGAVAILSASGYGNPSKESNITTTTGNNTGIILNTSGWENVAGCYNTSFGAINPIYYDSYDESPTSAKVGDALVTCAQWHGSTNAAYFSWYWTESIRGYGGIFSYSASHGPAKSCSRGVLVCGSGL